MLYASIWIMLLHHLQYLQEPPPQIVARPSPSDILDWRTYALSWFPICFPSLFLPFRYVFVVLKLYTHQDSSILIWDFRGSSSKIACVKFDMTVGCKLGIANIFFCVKLSIVLPVLLFLEAFRQKYCLDILVTFQIGASWAVL